MRTTRGPEAIRRSNHQTITLCLALVWLSAAACGQSLSEKIDALLKDPNLDHGIQAVIVRSLNTGQTLYERNPDIAMIPASNMKLLVSATALDQLGPDFTYSTRVLSAARANASGVIEGDIVLRGGGDPVLETADLKDLAKQIRSKGVRKVTGDLVVDDSLFDNQRLGWSWSWDDLPYYYAAQISALNLNRNVVGVWVYPGKKAGDAATVTIVPPTAYVEIEDTAITSAAGSKKTIWVDRRTGRNVIRVGGSIPVDAKVTTVEEPITVEEPALYAGHIFKDELGKQGVIVLGRVVFGKAPAGGAQFGEHISPPLSKILALLNKPSDNLIAEILLKTLGAAIKAKGTTEAGAEVEKDFFKKIGLDLTALNIVDGSGLSRTNYISARNLVGLLTHMHNHKHSQIYLDSLAIAGVDGTLRNRMKGCAAEKNVRAKSGYVNRVSALSGYVNTKSGEPLVFSILMNNHQCANTPVMAIQNAMCEVLAELP